MKAKPILLLLPLFLASCGGTSSSSLSSDESIEEKEDASISSSEEEKAPYSLDLRIATPSGAPAVAFYDHLEESDYLEINADATNVVAYLSENSPKDIVIVPTNAGLSAIIAKNAPFKIGATLTFGNFFLASTGNDENRTLDEEDYVVAFQQNNVPDKLLRYCYPELTNIHYVPQGTDAATALISGKNSLDNNAKVDYVLLAEPALSNALANNEDASQYASIQDVFKEKSGGMEITQASLFINNDADKAKVDAFLAHLEEDIHSFLEDPSVLDEAIKNFNETEIKAKFTSPASAIKKMTENGNRMGLGFKLAKDNKDSLAEFAKLFNINSIDEEVYYK